MSNSNRILASVTMDGKPVVLIYVELLVGVVLMMIWATR